MIKKIINGQKWSGEIARYRSQGMRTNFYADPEVFLPFVAEGRISQAMFAGGSYCFIEKENQVNFYFFLEKEADPVPVPALEKPLILEQVALEKSGISPTAEKWKAVGFQPYLKRKRLFLPAKDLQKEQREISFCTEGEAETILWMMEQAFEPYTSALPDRKILLKDLAEKRVIAFREAEKLMGFLRFGREKKVSVLWQIAVTPEGRGKGIGETLVRDWLAQEMEEVLKFQLWVREDNLPAFRMYEKLGFLPDGRIAPVMIK